MQVVNGGHQNKMQCSVPFGSGWRADSCWEAAVCLIHSIFWSFRIPLSGVLFDSIVVPKDLRYMLSIRFHSAFVISIPLQGCLSVYASCIVCVGTGDVMIEHAQALQQSRLA